MQMHEFFSLLFFVCFVFFFFFFFFVFCFFFFVFFFFGGGLVFCMYVCNTKRMFDNMYLELPNPIARGFPLTNVTE